MFEGWWRADAGAVLAARLYFKEFVGKYISVRTSAFLSVLIAPYSTNAFQLAHPPSPSVYHRINQLIPSCSPTFPNFAFHALIQRFSPLSGGNLLSQIPSPNTLSNSAITPTFSSL